MKLIENAVNAQVREHNTGKTAERVIRKADNEAKKQGYTLDWRSGLRPIILDTD